MAKYVLCYRYTATYITKYRHRKVNSERNPPGGWGVKNRFPNKCTLENVSTCSFISVVLVQSILEMRTLEVER